MKRFSLIIMLSLLTSSTIMTYAQEVTDAEIASIRAAYRDAKEQVEINSHAQEQNVPCNDMEVVSHYVIPGCGPTEEIIHYYFTLDEDPETGSYVNKPYLITRSYNVAARKFYEEFLFDKHDTSLLFFYQCNDATDGTSDETRYYYGKKGTHQSIKGSAQMDEVFAARLADELKSAFNLLMNRDF
ncbi:MAG: hypothetical protein IJK93_04420 [Muribaculaceae bacterium]|nr:hypothetical protein [Muribaculaceae bacterium]